jgi:hypothetical protein
MIIWVKRQSHISRDAMLVDLAPPAMSQGALAHLFVAHVDAHPPIFLFPARDHPWS